MMAERLLTPHPHCLSCPQGGLTWLWRDAPYVIAARKVFNMAVDANKKGDVFPVSCRSTCRVSDIANVHQSRVMHGLRRCHCD